MIQESMLTRREVIQGIVGASVTAMVVPSAFSEPVEKGITWPSPAGAAADPQRLQAFCSDWRFYRGDMNGAQSPDYNDASWRRLDVPHDWSIEDLPGNKDEGRGAIWTPGTTPTRVGPFDRYLSEGMNSTGWMVGGIGWYRKTFTKPNIPSRGGKAEIHFGGVYMNSDVWLNGVHLGNHPYGYTEFSFDLTPHLKDGQNTLAVRVNNTGRNSRWYSGSGIFRKVWLTVTGDLRLPWNAVCVTMPEVSADAALVNFAVTLESGQTKPQRVRVLTRLVDAAGSDAGVAAAEVIAAAGKTSTVQCAVHLKTPHLWSPDHPYLYRAEVAIEAGGKMADATALEIGIRKVEIDSKQGLRINGEGVKLRGAGVHHDNGPLGSACIPRAEERRVEILKANGFNAIRTTHNPPSRDFLDACDRLGILVIDEAFDCWEAAKNPQDYHLYFKDWWQRDLESIILRDRNHPSVILWSIGNEVTERVEPRGVEIGKQLQAYAHQLDPTRKVTAAITWPYDHAGQTWQDMEPAFSYLDVGGYNYGLVTRYNNGVDEFSGDHAKYPDRIMVSTESYPGEAFKYWRAVENSSWIIGDFVWAGIDYLGESGLGAVSLVREKGPARAGGSSGYPWFQSYCGDIDLIGNKKPQSFFRDVLWQRSKVEMAVQRPIPKGWAEHAGDWAWSDELHSWTWPGFEGTPLTVRVYTRGNKVSLFLNGKEVGSKDLAERDSFKAEFTVPYSPGELKAVAYQGGNEIGSITFATAGKAHSLKITADRPKMKSSRDDLSYVMVTVVDEQGRLVPDAVVPVSFVVGGVGEIAAVGSANPKDVASFRQPHHDTFHGACVVVVRPTGKSGQIEVRAESPGLGYTTARLDCESAT